MQQVHEVVDKVDNVEAVDSDTSEDSGLAKPVQKTCFIIISSDSDTEDTPHTPKHSVGNTDMQRQMKVKRLRQMSNRGRTLKQQTILSCDKCKKVYRNRDSLNKHERKFHNPTRFKCDFCGQKLCSEKNLNKHKLMHVLKTCVICDRDFQQKCIYDGHMREHAAEVTPFWCDLCDDKFVTETSLVKHKDENHKQLKKWKCPQCPSSFNCKDSYQSHLKLHENPDLYKCKTCGINYSSAAYLKKHSRMHTNDKPFVCVVCEKSFFSRSCLKIHMSIHTGDTSLKNRYKCEVCGQGYRCKGALRDHMNLHTGDKPHKCVFCGIGFAQRSTKISHELTHANHSSRDAYCETDEQCFENAMTSYDCDHCLVSFTQQIFLDQHLKTFHKIRVENHPKKNGFACNICRKLYTSPVDLGSHYVDVHYEKLPPIDSDHDHDLGMVRLKCKICGATKHKKNAADHLRNHVERKCVCRVCGMTFNLTSSLTRHMRMHTGETPIECKHCSKTFRTHEEMKKHKRTHPVKQKEKRFEKKYKCEKCDKVFLDNYHLARHSLTHANKLRCDVCFNFFRNVDVFEKHKIIHQ